MAPARLQRELALICVFALTACGGGSGASGSANGALPHTVTATRGTGKLTVAISIPPAATAQATARRPKFVSPSTQSIAITVGSAPAVNVNVTGSSPGCQTTTSAANAVFQEFAVGSQPRGITSGPDGAIWFNEDAGGAAGRIDLTPQHNYSDYSNGRLSNDILSANGSLWIADVYGAATLGNVAVNSNNGYSEVSLGTADGNGYQQTQAWLLSRGPDSAIWFTEFDPNYSTMVARIGRYLPSNASTTEFATQGLTYGVIGVPSDNAVWFTEGNGSTAWIGRISTTSQTLTNEFPLMALGAATPGPIALGPAGDNGLWFTDSNNNIDRFDLSAHTLTSYPIGYGGIDHLIAGADGALYFAEYGTNKIGRITTTGTLSEYTVPTQGSGPTGIALGPDNAIWFTEQNANKIGRLSFGSSVSCATTLSAPAGAQTVTVAAYDAAGGTTGSGQLLASETLPVTIVQNATNTIALTLNGVVNSIALAFAGTLPGGCPLNGAAPLSLQAFDVDGNLIFGPGGYIDANGDPLTVTLNDTDASGHSALSASSFTGPPMTPPAVNFSNDYSGASITATVSGGTLTGTSTATVVANANC